MGKVMIIVSIIMIIMLIIPCLPWALLYVGYLVSESPNKPEITYAEFPFELVYTSCDEERIITDTLICKFDGIGISEASGKVRKWKSYLKSGAEKLVLETYDNTIIYCDIGPASYYMGDNNA